MLALRKTARNWNHTFRLHECKKWRHPLTTSHHVHVLPKLRIRYLFPAFLIIIIITKTTPILFPAHLILFFLARKLPLRAYVIWGWHESGFGHPKKGVLFHGASEMLFSSDLESGRRCTVPPKQALTSRLSSLIASMKQMMSWFDKVTIWGVFGLIFRECQHVPKLPLKNAGRGTIGLWPQFVSYTILNHMNGGVRLVFFLFIANMLGSKSGKAWLCQ